MASWQSGKRAGVHLLVDAGRIFFTVRRDRYRPRIWRVYPGGSATPDPTPFPSLKAAKTIAESWAMPACRECGELFDSEELVDGVCYECGKEECPSCEGSGYSDYYDDEDGLQECEDCGGDGVV